MKHLLIVYHSRTGNTRIMAESAYLGATNPDIDAVETRLLYATEAGVQDLLWADGLLLGTPENFGYMSGSIKDFLERTYYSTRDSIDSLPYAMFISAGNDGTGAINSIRRIAKGYPFDEVQPPIISRGVLMPQTLDQCEELGMTLAAGLEANIF